MARDKNTFKENMTFDYTELTALCEHLKIREREGKRLKEIDKYSLIYDKCESRDIRYSAVIFSNSLMHSDFVASCEQEDWEYVTSHNELYIFRTQSPDAGEIMTDEKDYLRIVTKRFLLKPSFLGFSYLTFNTLFRFLLHIAEKKTLWLEAPLSVDLLFYLWLFLLIIVLMIAYIKCSEYIEWYVKSKKAVRNGEKIPFLNLEEQKNKIIARNIIYCIYITVLSASFIYMFFGYLEKTDIFYSLSIAPCVLAICFIFNKFKKKNIIKAIVLSFLSITVILAGAYGLTIKSNTAFYENTKINKGDAIPVSISDFGCTNECHQENELYSYNGTRLAQHYIFKSYCPNCLKSIRYCVFVSDYPIIRKSYINALKKEHNSATLYQNEYNRWDEQYRIISYDEITNYGFAVKGNTIVYFPESLNSLNYSSIDFFDMAYEKLFD